LASGLRWRKFLTVSLPLFQPLTVVFEHLVAIYLRVDRLSMGDPALASKIDPQQKKITSHKSQKVLTQPPGSADNADRVPCPGQIWKSIRFGFYTWRKSLTNISRNGLF
jgi:hypothetical protein